MAFGHDLWHYFCHNHTWMAIYSYRWIGILHLSDKNTPSSKWVVQAVLVASGGLSYARSCYPLSFVHLKASTFCPSQWATERILWHFLTLVHALHHHHHHRRRHHHHHHHHHHQSSPSLSSSSLRNPENLVVSHCGIWGGSTDLAHRIADSFHLKVARDPRTFIQRIYDLSFNIGDLNLWTCCWTFSAFQRRLQV